MNLTYIRAAIMEATGIKLSIDEVKAYLLSEGMATRTRMDKLTFNGYGAYFGDIPVDVVPDLKEVLVEEGVEIDELEIIDDSTN